MYDGPKKTQHGTNKRYRENERERFIKSNNQVQLFGAEFMEFIEILPFYNSDGKFDTNSN